MEEADYYLNKLNDDFYSMSEAVSYVKNKINLTAESLSYYSSAYDDLIQKYKLGDISEEKYVEGLKEVRNGYYE
jgi:hypothetical protein